MCRQGLQLASSLSSAVKSYVLAPRHEDQAPRIDALRMAALMVNDHPGRDRSTQKFRHAFPGDKRDMEALMGKLRLERRIREMSDLEAAYLAGLIDGDGSIFVERRSGMPLVVISSTDGGLIRSLRGLGHQKPMRVDHHKPHYITKSVKPCWNLRWHAAVDVKALLEQVIPFMRIDHKRERARRALKIVSERLAANKKHVAKGKLNSWPGPESSEKTRKIIATLRRHAGKEPWGFRSGLAKKHGVNRQRISNIAISIGLTPGSKSKKGSK